MSNKYCTKTAHCKNADWCAEDKDFGENCEWYDALTNADKIRSMSDEELAEWIETIAGCKRCPNFMINRGTVSDSCAGESVESRGSCKLHWLRLLKKEVK